ncbi:MAG: RNA polymerase subunit sigma-70 [Flavobacteriaceae bacterium]|nr:RNA polymerase subunit sigma-70 [Flavobacteriaceae bacterium]
MSTSNSQLTEQINKAKKGSQSAFNFLLNFYWSDIYNFLLKRTSNENEAEDITIQTFSKGFDKIDLFDDQYAFKTWLTTIAKNLHLDMVRKRKNSKSIDTTYENDNRMHQVIDENPSPEDKLIQEQNLAKLLRDIKQLKPKYQEVIQLRFFQEMSYKEIASQLDEPISNVKVKLLRAKKLLAEIIIES